MSENPVRQFVLLNSNRQKLPNSGASSARSGMNGEYISRGTAGPWQVDVDVQPPSGTQGGLYLVGPLVGELRSATSDVTSATLPVLVAYDADGIADLPAAGAKCDGVAVALETQGGKTWARVVLLNDGLLYGLAGAANLAAGTTCAADANGHLVAAASADQAVGVTVRAAVANNPCAFRGARGKV